MQPSLNPLNCLLNGQTHPKLVQRFVIRMKPTLFLLNLSLTWGCYGPSTTYTHTCKACREVKVYFSVWLYHKNSGSLYLSSLSRTCELWQYLHQLLGWGVGRMLSLSPELRGYVRWKLTASLSLCVLPWNLISTGIGIFVNVLMHTSNLHSPCLQQCPWLSLALVDQRLQTAQSTIA